MINRKKCSQTACKFGGDLLSDRVGAVPANPVQGAFAAEWRPAAEFFGMFDYQGMVFPVKGRAAGKVQFEIFLYPVILHRFF